MACDSQKLFSCAAGFPLGDGSLDGVAPLSTRDHLSLLFSKKNKALTFSVCQIPDSL